MSYFKCMYIFISSWIQPVQAVNLARPVHELVQASNADVAKAFMGTRTDGGRAQRDQREVYLTCHEISNINIH